MNMRRLMRMKEEALQKNKELYLDILQQKAHME